MNDLHAVLRDATDHLRADPTIAHKAWAAAHRRKRRRAVAMVLGAAASVALVLGLATSWPTRAPDPSLAPQPTPQPTESAHPSETGPRIDPTYDPTDWTDLPEYPVDLGYWLSPERPRPLAEFPAERASVAISFFLSPEEANLSVIGSDGEWRSIDVSGLTFADNGDYELGLSRHSLSPDGTRVALGQPDGVVVIDLRTAEQTHYPVAGLGALWAGRTVSWTADGSAVLLARAHVATRGPEDLAYQPGFRVDLGTGVVSRMQYDPDNAAQLADGTVVADLWRQGQGHRIIAFGPDGSGTDWRGVQPYLGAPDSFSGYGSRWAIRREAMMNPDAVDGRSGFMAFEGDSPLAMLPVEGVENNGGGGRVVGWLDESTLLVAMPGADVLAGTVAWNVETGRLWRGPQILVNSRVSIAGQP